MSKKILVTSALPYIHGIPHLGNIVGSILPADIYYRFQRLKGKSVIYICGSDSHGTMYEVTASKKNMSPKKLVYDYHEKVKKIFGKLKLDFSYYGITDSKENKDMTNHIFNKLKENGYIFEKELELPYCRNCEKFLSDRFIEGECPYCGGLARGDQCDDCGKLLDPQMLKEPYCVYCGKEDIDFKNTKHLFIDLQKFESWLRKWWKKGSKNWNKIPRKITESWLKEGLKPRAITRDAEWGFEVPGYKNKIFYVWFDAPIGYISATKEWAEKDGGDWKDWWFGDTKLVQFMGKDNVVFHTIIFPSMLKGTDENWVLPENIVASAYLLVRDTKFSKSRGKGLTTEKALEFRGGDYWRFFLSSLYPKNHDIEFDLDLLQSKINDELIGNYGNFIYRALSFINKKFEGFVSQETDEDVEKQVRGKVEDMEKMIENFNFGSAVSEIISIASLGNKYFQENEPWKNPDPKVLNTCANLCKTLSVISEPFMPETAGKIWKFLNLKGSVHEQNLEDAKKFTLKNHKINKPEPLFQKVSDEELENLK